MLKGLRGKINTLKLPKLMWHLGQTVGFATPCLYKNQCHCLTGALVHFKALRQWNSEHYYANFSQDDIKLFRTTKTKTFCKDFHKYPRTL